MDTKRTVFVRSLLMIVILVIALSVSLIMLWSDGRIVK